MTTGCNRNLLTASKLADGRCPEQHSALWQKAPKERLTYLLTPWCRVLLEKLTSSQLIKKFPAFHGTRRFITALTSVRHMSLSWASPSQSIYPHPTSWRPILILSIHLRLGLPSGFLPSVFPTKTLYTPLSSPIRATCPAHLILLDFITHTILGRSTNHLAPRYAISSIPPLRRPSYSPQHHVLKHPRLPFLPQCQRPRLKERLAAETRRRLPGVPECVTVCWGLSDFTSVKPSRTIRYPAGVDGKKLLAWNATSGRLCG